MKMREKSRIIYVKELKKRTKKNGNKEKKGRVKQVVAVKKAKDKTIGNKKKEKRQGKKETTDEYVMT
jgi:hypothetical protein